MAKDKNNVTLNETDQAAIETATAAGIESPASISETHPATIEELQQRIIVLENQVHGLSNPVSTAEPGHDLCAHVDGLTALIHHLYSSFHRTIDPAKVIADYHAAKDGSKVINPGAR